MGPMHREFVEECSGSVALSESIFSMLYDISTGTPTLGVKGAAAPPALFQGLTYFSAKVFMMHPQ